MDASRTPLLDLFKRGEVARDLRLLAAQGALAPRAQEQLGMLVHLASDGDQEVAQTARQTIGAIPTDQVANLLARSDVPPDIRDFFQARGVQPAASATGDPEAPIVDAGPSAEPAPENEDELGAFQRIAAMNVAQRMSLAMKGTREDRAILIRDPNKIVAAAVLSSPKLTESEVERISRMSNVSEDTLRIIAHTRAWMKNYAIVSALTKNPKTPVALSMNLLSRLNEKDLRTLSSDRNVPDVLRITARKKIVIDK
jgi:hypothetical protein